MRAEYILFDLDGTIIKSDSGITKSFQAALSYFGIREKNIEILKSFVGPPLHESFMNHYQFTDEMYEKALKVFRKYYMEKGIYECELYPDVVECLRALRESGRKLYIATSKPEPQAKKVIRHLGIEKYFQMIGGADGDRNTSRATKAAVIDYVLKENKIYNIEKVLMVGDRSHDIIGAKANGLLSAGLLYGYGTREELESAGADKIYENIRELKEYILGREL